MADWWQLSVGTLKGVGPAKSRQLSKLNIFTVGDVINMVPVSDKYQDRRNFKKIEQLQDSCLELFSATVVSSSDLRTKNRLTLSKLLVQDDTGQAEIVWFNQKYRARQYKVGMKVVIAGKVKRQYNMIQIHNAQVDSVNNDGPKFYGCIVPVYPATESISQDFLRNLVKQALDGCTVISETIPVEIINKFVLISRKEALINLHFPQDWDMLNKARQRLVFEELFFLQCLLLITKKKHQACNMGIKHAIDGRLMQSALGQLPYQLTADQLIALQEIKLDMESKMSMQRLLQGDVGSGKTVVAGLALIKTVENGFQGAIMAPTEILAEQHYHTLSRLFACLGIRFALLTGGLAKTARSELLKSIACGSVDIIIGTHAILQQDVVFKNLGLVVTDEQHRFGVRQRALFQNKGISPDVLVMTATPIPRTMTLTVYGDLDVSQIKSLPPGRKPVRTLKYSTSRRKDIYDGVLRQLAQGRQAFVVCPLVEDSELIRAESATTMYSLLTENYLMGVPCGLLHGKLSQQQKDKVMRDFCDGTIKVLISTTVIEVGINVPNATIMIIEGADRFGLAQLHQLRGRVGRGEHESYCVLITDSDNEDTRQRLDYLAKYNDGFILAEKDLLIRGPGQLFGTRQHGLPDLRIADIIKDTAILIKARQAAKDILNDPQQIKQVLPGIALHFGNNYAAILNS